MLSACVVDCIFLFFFYCLHFVLAKTYVMSDMFTVDLFRLMQFVRFCSSLGFIIQGRPKTDCSEVLQLP